jgi:hypothetical protein
MLKRFLLFVSFILSSSHSLANTQFTYERIDGGLEITGCIETCPFDLVIPNSIGEYDVVSIGGRAFADNQLTSVSIPDSVKSIGFVAFRDNQLSSVFIPSSVEKIGNGAFRGNNIDVSNIFLQEGLKIIESDAFGDQNHFQDHFFEPPSFNINLVIPNSVTSIGDDAFGLSDMGELELDNVHVEATDTILDMFIASTDFASLTGSGGEFEFGEEFIYLIWQDRAIILGCNFDCPSDLVIPDYIDGFFGTVPVTDIGKSFAFAGQGLTSVVIPNSVRTIGSYAFYSNQLTSVNIPDNVSVIGESAFEDNQLSAIALPESITSIGDFAFRSNYITNFTIPESIVSVGDHGVFADNPIVNVNIPGGVLSEFIYIFDRDSGVVSDDFSYVVVSGSAMITGCADTCSNELFIPPKIDDYNVSSIGFQAFQRSGLTSITIPNGVKIIEPFAFQGNQLTEVTIPDGVITIERSAFSGNQLTFVNIPDSVTSIGSDAFKSNLFTEMVIPDGIAVIEYKAFASNSLNSVVIPDNVTAIHSAAFQANQLTSVSFPESINSIGSWAFWKNQLTSLIIPSEITHIKDNAFAENQLTHLHFEGEPPKIDNTAFSSNALTSISYCQNNNGNWDNVIIEGITPLLDCDTDGVEDSLDAFPLDPSETTDTDLDGIGNNADTDDDGDGVEDNLDVFPLDPSETLDTDLDGIGNNADTDDDNDGKNDIDDLYPLNHLYHADSDSDNMPDAWELLFGLNPNDPTDTASDSDNDGIVALQEFFEGTPPGPEVTVVSNDLSWDFDQSGNLDALTDGLLLLRYAFGLRNEGLTIGAISAESALSQAEVESNIEQALSIADIDNSGEVDALTDGLLLIRYAFGARGGSLISGAVSTQGIRNTATNIEAYIESHMP